MITIDNQIEGMKMLDKAYEEYKKTKSFVYSDKLYEYGYKFLEDMIGYNKLKEIHLTTNGFQRDTRIAHIKYLFEEIYGRS